MRVLYLDCYSGISGDMLIGALLDAGLSFGALKRELSKLGLNNAFKIEKKIAFRGTLKGTKFNVITKNDSKSRTLANVESIIKKSRLVDDIKLRAIDMFRHLAGAEAKSHGNRPRATHLHEVGRIDSIVDIVGTTIALKLLRIDAVYASVVRVGSGAASSEHGAIPIPSPATMNLLQGSSVRFTNIKKELTTPTGAAILRTLADGFGEMPEMKIRSTGYGAGSRELKKQPNMLRAVIGEASPYVKDAISVLETNIDDMNPQIFDPLSRRLFKAGAIDVYLTPVFMKKYRPGILLTVLCKNEHVLKLSSIIFKETTTLGIRRFMASRDKLRRAVKKLPTKYGVARFKVSFAPGMEKVQPEYRDFETISRKESIPLKDVYEEAIPGRR